jgi:hypothetical protein
MSAMLSRAARPITMIATNSSSSPPPKLLEIGVR